MIKVTKVELFTNDIHGEPVDLNRTLQCPSGNIYVKWTTFEEDLMCAEVRINDTHSEGFYFTGRYFKRAKFYFDNGYVWDTLLKPEDEWRRKVYEELKRYIDSGYEIPPTNEQSELSRAAQLLDTYEDLEI